MASPRTLHCIAALAATLCVAACADSSTRDSPPAQSADRDPPGVAQLLSLGNERMLEGMSAFDSAAKCAAALKVTLSAVRAMTGVASSQEIGALQEVEQLYRRRAVDGALAEGRSAAAAAEAIKREEVTATGSEQGQLAIACLKAVDRPA